MIDLSVIIVNYKSSKVLIECLRSIYDSKPKSKFEIIVVDNGDVLSLKNDLRKLFPKVGYYKNESNLGFGAGNNVGAKHANGKYLFFLNPDTLIFPKTLDLLLDFFKKNKNIGIVSPLVLDKDQKAYKLQAYKELTPLNAIISFSIFKNIFWKKSIFEKFTLSDYIKKPIREVDSVYGAALMIPKDIYEKVNGFDEDFFLYFEENDLSKRLKNLGFKLYINSNSKIIHKVAQSTSKFAKRDEVFAKSRYLYLKKHFGPLKALAASLILKLDKKSALLMTILGLALYLRFFNISKSMEFIGDQGWFYLSARDLLINGQIPLVGITSSHTWLHQGPLWTYMLSIALFISKFDPIGGAYLTATVGILTAFLMYKIGSKMFSVRVGIIASVLYAVSPLIVFWERFPFDPAVIPFFTVLYIFAIHKWINGNKRYFPAILFLIAILYNLELATFTLFFPFALFVIYGLLKNKSWVKDLRDFKFVLCSVLIGLVSMIPVIIYDLSHGFKQTIVFLGWTFYKPFSFLFHQASAAGNHNFGEILNFIAVNLQKLLFSGNLYVSLLIFIGGIGYLVYAAFKKKKSEYIILLFLLSTAILGVVVNQTPSDAYLPILFPFVIFMSSIFLNYLFSISRLSVILIIVIVFLNAHYVTVSYSREKFSERIKAADEIISLTKNSSYNLIGKGPGSQFESYTMNYEYLLWWKNHPVSKKNEKLKVIISEDSMGIHVEKLNDK